MAKKMFLAGVGTLDAFVGAEKLFTSKTLIESSIAIGVTAEEVRAGDGAGLIGKYYHTSSMTLTATDALFSLEYIALNLGTDIVVGGDVLTTETVIVETATELTVEGTPVDCWGQGTIGWYRIPSAEDEWKKATFKGKTATVAGLPVGKEVCVQYNSTNSTLREVTVPSNIIPSECRVYLTANLYAGEEFDITTSSRVGRVVVEIPRFVLDGNVNLSMSMTGASSTDLTGSALISYEGATCEGAGYYAKIKEVVVGASVYDGISNLVVAGTGFKVGDTITTKAIYSNAKPKTIDPTALAYEVEGAVIDPNTGKVVSVSTSSPILRVKIRDSKAGSFAKSLEAETKLSK